jgi:hypothetical protein
MSSDDLVAMRPPTYVRVLRLRRLRIGGLASFLLFECMIAGGVLLALAELTSWWAVPVLPTAVALMVKINDLAMGGGRSRAPAWSGGGLAHGRPSHGRSSRGRLAGGAMRPAGGALAPAAEDGDPLEPAGAAAGRDSSAPASGSRARARLGRFAPQVMASGRGRRAGGGSGADGETGDTRVTAAHDRASLERPALDRASRARTGQRAVDSPEDSPRRPIGTIRISVPPRDGGASRTASTGTATLTSGSGSGGSGSGGRHARQPVDQPPTGAENESVSASGERHGGGRRYREERWETGQNQGRFA